MSDSKRVTRREFTASSALALLGGVAITVSGCNDDDDGGSMTSPTPTPSARSDVSGSVSANHGHTAVVTAARLDAGGGFTLDITGGANHPHTVDLSDGDLTQIASGARVSKTSSTDQSHSHSVTFN